MDEIRLPQHIVRRIERRWAARLGQMTRPEQSAPPPDARGSISFPAVSDAFRPSWSSRLGHRDSCPRTTV
jgi:hypothetical protein